MNFVSRYPAWVAAGLAALFLGAALAPPDESVRGMNLHAFAKLPVVDSGRVKPIDTVARTSLMVISNRQTVHVDDNGKDLELTPVRWLLDVLSSRDPFDGPAAGYKVFRIENDQVLNLLGLEMRPGSYRYSLKEIGKNYPKLEQEVKRVGDMDPKERNLFDTKVYELGQHLDLYAQLAGRKVPLVAPQGSGDEEWFSLAQVDEVVRGPVGDALQELFAQKGIDPKKLNDAQIDELRGLLNAMIEKKRAEVSPVAGAYADALAAYRDGKAEKFNEAVAKVKATSVPDRDAGRILFRVFGVTRTGLETAFNDFAPFYQCMVLYVVVFLLTCVAWVVWAGPLNRAAFGLAALTLVIHTLALIARMYIQGRPPITNLYSSAVFIGWACAVMGLGLEAYFGMGIGNVVTAVLGVLTSFVAHHLGGSGDTLEMMQAVLDTNFWLATHVVVINLGYAATFVAGCLGVRFILTGVFSRQLDAELFKVLSQVTYGCVCFGTLLSFVGTVLGGIWADQSWGRFWGWDPKENGALLIVIWNALILHARWGGLVKQRGVAVLAAAGNTFVLWSWFGTNQLGVGLHAYGFSNTLAMLCTVSWVLLLGIVAVGLVPVRKWRSFGGRGGSPVPNPAPPSPRRGRDILLGPAAGK
jgi:ABC-type transport system involved in cytochrome c biogenesis permease subunit